MVALKVVLTCISIIVGLGFLGQSIEAHKQNELMQAVFGYAFGIVLLLLSLAIWRM